MVTIHNSPSKRGRPSGRVLVNAPLLHTSERLEMMTRSSQSPARRHGRILFSTGAFCGLNVQADKSGTESAHRALKRACELPGEVS